MSTEGADPTAPEPARPEQGSPEVVGRRLDELAANATVAPITRLIDGWLCKAAPGLPFRRANAVLPAAFAGADARAAAVALDAIEAWYGSFGQRVLVQVSSADPAAALLDQHLDARGYVVEAPVDLLVAEAGAHSASGLHVAVAEERGAGGPSADPAIELVVEEGVSAAWAARYGAVHGDDETWRARTEAYGRMLAGLGPAVLGGAALIDGEVAGVGFGVLERGWVGIYGMGTAPAFRRRGVAGALLGALATEARRHHGTHAYLQVETDNAPAQRLYRGLGFTSGHGYHYRVSDRG